MRAAVGVDGCPGGWIAWDGARALVRPTFAAILAELPEDAVVGIDIPTDLPLVPGRACEAAARARLAGRASTVFPTFPREVLTAPTYADARALCTERGWKRPSAQAFALRHRILEVEPLVGDRILEVHPELSFLALHGAPLPSKHTPEGRTLRRALVGLPEADSDLLDAAAARWTARRYVRGEAERLPPEGTGRDAIWV